ncbi:MAG TPA: LLM class F420-dependent oxidoreductase [Pseudomonadales bacterium]|jgi:probable F420-dependent oxidoreductase|nr:LLM class F420-dependent oxidoreductase [Pseudomonadales bacterium]
MKIGVFATFMSPQCTPQFIVDFGRRAESAGLDSIWMGEHVVLFDRTEFPYPGSRDGKLPVPEGAGMLDSVATFGFLASVTKTIRFGTGIALISQRNPLYTAKEFTTLDWLSGGRIDFGIGVGWCKEEVLASGYSWEDRGARSDEFLEMVTRLWTHPVASYQGKHFQLADCRLDPKPVQKPHPPILVGGHSAAALRRAARYGSGWYGFAIGPEQTAPVLQLLDKALAAEGRSRDGFEVVITPPYRVSDDMLRGFADLGVDRVVPQLGSQKPEAVSDKLKELERFVRVAA